VKTDEGSSAPRLPTSQHRVQALPHVGKVCEFSIQVGTLPQHKAVNMRARQAPGSLDRHDLSDLFQHEPEPLRLPDERQQVQRVGPVDAVARCGAPRGRQDAGGLVQPQRLSAHAALLRHLTDQQAVAPHDHTVNPAPGEKVKREETKDGPVVVPPSIGN
jgi:hypothetical protein